MKYWKRVRNYVIVDVIEQEQCPEYYVAATATEYKNFNKNTGPILVPDIIDE